MIGEAMHYENGGLWLQKPTALGLFLDAPWQINLAPPADGLLIENAQRMMRGRFAFPPSTAALRIKPSTALAVAP